MLQLKESIEVARIIIGLHNSMYDFSDYIVGGRVTCTVYGKGLIKTVHDITIDVEFTANTEKYLKNGMLVCSAMTTLQHGHCNTSLERVALADATLGGVMPLDTIAMNNRKVNR